MQYLLPLVIVVELLEEPDRPAVVAVADESVQPSANQFFAHDVVVVAVVDEAEADEVDEIVAVGSLQPNHPGVSHEVLLMPSVLLGLEADGVTMAEEGVVDEVPGTTVVVVVMMVVGSLQPNQPGVLHEVVVVINALVEVDGTVLD